MLKLKTIFFITMVCVWGVLTSCSADTKHLEAMDGHSIAWSDLRGKWIFINYWASWCEPCLHEIPELNKFYDGGNQKNMALFAVNYDGLSIPEQEKLISQYRINYPSLKEDPQTMLHLGDIRGLPATFVFNPEGKLVSVLYGAQSLSKLKKAMT